MRVGPVDGAMQETQKGAQRANPKAALRAFLGVEFQAPAGAPIQIALDIMREVLLGPNVVIAASE
ncbi:MAG TPA: hypothetical protein VKG38_07915 [Solirubrobacteraceae bacterium]|nr:hypothetical protein [Solirubrobacteraceae bacterium]